MQVWTEHRSSMGPRSETYFPRALKEWLKDLEATLSKVCRNTSTFRGLKLSPSSENGAKIERLSVSAESNRQDTGPLYLDSGFSLV